MVEGLTLGLMEGRAVVGRSVVGFTEGVRVGPLVVGCTVGLVGARVGCAVGLVGAIVG